jgi:uncharacterized membrane protein
LLEHASMRGELIMIIFALILLCVGAGSAILIIVMAVRGALGHNTPEHGLPSRTTMRRYMLMGLYCNPDDPRALVPHPSGRGRTLNMRSEQLASALWIMLAVTIIATILLVMAMNSSP